MNTETIGAWLPFLSGLAFKSLAVFAMAGLALLILRRASASARHLVCLLTLAGLLVLPILSLALPGWRLAVALPTAAIFGTRPISQSDEFPIPAHKFATLPSEGRVPDKNSLPLLTNPAISANAPVTKTLPSEGRVVSVRTGIGNTFPWTAFLSTIWLLGFCVSLLRPLLGLWGIACLSRTSQIATDASLLESTSECASALNLTQKTLLRQADAPVPMTWGDRQPVILLPTEAQAWPQDRLHAVLLHEMAHIRRRDWLSHRFADVVCALYWFHPLVWLTARRLRAESEIACDDLVLTSGIAAPDYARHLLAVARALHPAAVPQAAIAMAQTCRLEGRLTMILDTTRPRRALTRRALLLTLGLSAAALVPLAALRPAARAQAASHQMPSQAAFVKTKGVTVRFKSLTLNGDSASLQLSASSVLARSSGRSFSSMTFSPDLTINGTALLAGVTEADKPGAPWWSASGRAISPVYDTAPYHAESHASGSSTKNVAFAFRLPPSLAGATVRYDLPGSHVYSSDGSWPLKTQGRDHLTEAQWNGATNNTRVVTAEYPASATEATVRVGIASGPWHKAAGQAPTHYTGSGVVTPEGTFIFSAVTPEKGNIWSLTLTTSEPKQDTRLVAVDAQGHEILPSTIGDTTAGGLDQITARFVQPLTQIQEFRVETRPFHWVGLKDIALQPVP